MKDTRLIKLIKTFTKEELKSFEKFLQSPFLRPARDTTQLYKYIVNLFPEYDPAKTEKRKVFKKLFGDEEYSEKKIQNLIFYLTKAAEDFLAFNTLMEDETEFLLSLSKGYLNKKLSDESNRVNKLIEKKMQPGFSQKKDYISKFRKLSYLKSSYFIEMNEFENLIGMKMEYFEAASVQFIIDYVEIVSSIIPAKETYGKEMNNYFIDSIINNFDLEKLEKFLEKSDYKDKSIILIHYYLLKISSEGDNTFFYYLLRDLFYDTLTELDREEKYILFGRLINYCVQKIGKNEKEFIKEGLHVCKKMLENNAYSHSENEYMQVMTYRNINQFCISSKDYKWLEYFIEKYTECLQPELREDLKNLSYGYLYYSRKEFEKALVELSKINHEFFLFKTDLKNLMLILYYEMNYIEPAYSMVDSYKHFLSNTKEITAPYKKIFNNFLNLYFDLLKMKCGQSKEKASFIKNIILKENQLVSRSWLLEKADELISKKL